MMKTVYEPANVAEAHMLQALLGQQGISVEIQGEHLQSGIGELPASGLVRLVADEKDHAAARAFIETWEALEKEKIPPTKKSPSRASVGFLIGLIVGIGGMYLAYRSPYTEQGVDYDGDGRLDETWAYSLNGTPIRVDMDRNRNGKIDYVLRYDSRGIAESAEADDDFNGVFESKERFEYGVLKFSETDSNGDGKTDMRWNYSNGVHATTDFFDRTVLPVRVEYYALGVLTHADVDTDGDGRLDTRKTYLRNGEFEATKPLSQQ